MRDRAPKIYWKVYMSAHLFRRLHRWVALLFALPLLVVIVTGLILSAIPIIHAAAVRPGSIAQTRLEEIIRHADPEGIASALTIDWHDRVLTLEGLGKGSKIDIDMDTGGKLNRATPVSDFIAGAKELHRRFVFGRNYLTIACSFAMIALAILGLGIGFARPRNTLQGWHRIAACGLLPLVAISPLTGALDGLNISFTDRPGTDAPRAPPMPLIEALRQVDARFDPATVYSVTTRGRDGGVARVFDDSGAIVWWRVTGQGLTPAQRNLPREIHEGTWSGVAAGVVNFITAAAILFLLGTGLLIWSRASRRRRANAARRSAARSFAGETA